MLVKLQTKASVKSTQLLMLRGLKLFSHALEHERNVLHGNALVAVCDVDSCGIVD